MVPRIGTLIKGLIIGLSIAAPVGPIGLFCIRRTLAHGRAAGFISGLGAATADGLYGAVAAFGLTFISYTSTLLLTLANPLTILSFAAVFAGLGLGSAQRDFPSALVLVLGVFAGSALWWLTLSTGVGLLRRRVETSLLVWVNRVSGAIIAAFGVAALVSLA